MDQATLNVVNRWRRERGESEVLPWDHIDSGLDKEWLWDDWQDALDETEVDETADAGAESPEEGAAAEAAAEDAVVEPEKA